MCVCALCACLDVSYGVKGGGASFATQGTIGRPEQSLLCLFGGLIDRVVWELLLDTIQTLWNAYMATTWICEDCFNART